MQINTQLAKAFNRAVTTAENINSDGSINWNFVDADMYMELSVFYSGEYICECFNTLADNLVGA